MTHKHTRPLRVAAALLLTLVLGPWGQAALAAPAAQGAAPTAQGSLDSGYSFAEMGLSLSALASPEDRQTLSFSLPAGQRIAEGASLTLDLRTEILDTATAELPADLTENLGGLISVSFNGENLTRLPLTAEPQRTVSLDIPDELLATPPADGRYSLSLQLSTDAGCEFGDAIRVSLGEGSRFELPTAVAPITPTLAALPAPLYQRSFLPETAILVVPDEPSEAELRSAMIVAAGLGRLTGSNLGLLLRRVSDLSEEERSASHLVMVGTPSDLPPLQEVELPAAVEDGLFVAPELRPDDGVVQAAPSPWGDARMVLVVGGNSEAGLLKAAQATALNQLLLESARPDLSLIAEVNVADETIPPVERSFADLGYTDARRVSAIGVSNLNYSFSIPAGQMAGEEASVEIAFAHAAIINFDESSLTVVLNGNEIGGVRLSEETVDLTRASFLMPSDVLRAGRNDLQLRVNLAAPVGCVDKDEIDAWLNVWPDSRVIVPLEPAGEAQLRSVSLDSYPTLLTGSPTLSDAAFVVGPDDPAGWEAAAQLVANLATQTNEAPVDFAVAYDGAVAEELRQSHNLVLVGRPSQLELVSELNDQLPAPFEPGSDAAIDRISRVSFRLAAEKDVGYLELLTAPWNQQRVVLAVLGNSQAGVGQAVQALTRGALRSRLGGNFALVAGEQIFIGGTRLAVSAPEAPEPTAPAAPAGAAPDSAAAATPAPAATSTATAPRSAPPLILALGASLVVMLLVVGGVAGLSAYRRNRQP